MRLSSIRPSQRVSIRGTSRAILRTVVAVLDLHLFATSFSGLSLAAPHAYAAVVRARDEELRICWTPRDTVHAARVAAQLGQDGAALSVPQVDQRV